MTIFAIVPEPTIENLGAVAVLGAGFLVGVRWILAHVSKLSDRQFEIMNGLLEKNHTLIGEVAEILRQNNRLLASVQRKMESLPEVLTAATERALRARQPEGDPSR